MMTAVLPDASEVDAMLIAVIVVLVGVIGMFAKLLGLTKTSAQQATEANQAVNTIGPGETRLYDRVEHLDEKLSSLIEAQKDFTEKGWRRLPEDLADATRMTLTIRALQDQASMNSADHRVIVGQLGKIERFIAETLASGNGEGRSG